MSADLSENELLFLSQIEELEKEVAALKRSLESKTKEAEEEKKKNASAVLPLPEEPLKLTRSASDPLEKKGKDVRVFAGGQSYRMTSVREGSKVEFKFSPAASPAAEPPSIPAPASAPSIAALSSASMTASSCGSAVASSAPSAVATSVVPSSTAAKHVEVIGSGASPFVLPAAAASILPAALSSFTSSPQVASALGAIYQALTTQATSVLTAKSSVSAPAPAPAAAAAVVSSSVPAPLPPSLAIPPPVPASASAASGSASASPAGSIASSSAATASPLPTLTRSSSSVPYPVLTPSAEAQDAANRVLFEQATKDFTRKEQHRRDTERRVTREIVQAMGAFEAQLCGILKKMDEDIAAFSASCSSPAAAEAVSASSSSSSSAPSVATAAAAASAAAGEEKAGPPTLRSLLQGKYVEVDASAFDAQQYYSKPIRPKRTLQRASSAFTGDKYQSNAGRIISILIENKRQQKSREEQKHAQEMQKLREAQERKEQAEKRAERALMEILPVMPQLTIEQAARALELNADDGARALNFVLSLEAADIDKRLAPAPLPPPASAAAIAAAADEKEDLPVLFPSDFDSPAVYSPFAASAYAASADDPGKKIIFRVEFVQQEKALVELVPVLDRNRMPIDQQKCEQYIASFPLLLNMHHLRLCSADEVACIEKDRRDRVAVITYQAIKSPADTRPRSYEDEYDGGGGDSGDSFCPIDIKPRFPLSDYRMDYDHSAGKLKSVTHKSDGEILFRAHADDGSFGLYGQGPVEVFTQVLSPESINVVHMHLEDIRDNITFDMVNLTGKAPEELAKVTAFDSFKPDVTGQKLTYKIVAKDSKIVGVYYIKAQKVERAVTIETAVPDVGSLVQIVQGHSASAFAAAASAKYSLGVLRSVPTGMLVSVSPPVGELERKASESSESNQACMPVGHCTARHPSSLDGLVSIDVTFEDGKLVDPPRPVLVPICSVRPATEEQQTQLLTLQTSSAELQSRSLRDAFAKLESIVTSHATLGADGQPVTSMEEVERLRAEVVQLRAASPDLAQQIDQTRLNKVLRAIQSYAWELKSLLAARAKPAAAAPSS